MTVLAVCVQTGSATAQVLALTNRPGCIKFFFKHNVALHTQNGERKCIESLLAYIGWYKVHPERNFIPLLATLWYPESEPLCADSFIPISRISSRCAQAEVFMNFPQRPYNSGKVVVIIPLEFDSS